MNNTRCNTRSRTNGSAMPSFSNIINEIMNAPIHTANKEMRTSTPAVNILQDDKKYTIDMVIPGYSKKEINIEIMDNQLIISSKKDVIEDVDFKLREFNYGNFSRKFNLPKDADRTSITANVTNGILKVSISKMPESSPIQIKIK